MKFITRTILSGQVTHKYSDPMTKNYFVGFGSCDEMREEIVDNITYQKAQPGDSIEISVKNCLFYSTRKVTLNQEGL